MNRTIVGQAEDGQTTLRAVDQLTASAKQMIDVSIGNQDALDAIVNRAKVDPRPMDVTMLLLKSLSAISRTQAFLLNEMLMARGEPSSIRFRTSPENGGGH